VGVTFGGRSIGIGASLVLDISLSLSLILKHGQKNVHGIVILYVRTYVLAYIKCLLIGCFLRFFGSFPFISGLFSPRCAHV
jgi:hypothetical protein